MENQEYKKGQTWWFVINREIKRYEYLCPFPFHNPKNLGSYHILIYKNLDFPERFYKDRLDELISQYGHINSYEEAKIEKIKQVEEYLKLLKERN